MKNLILLFFTLTILSCSKKEVKIPTLAEKGIQEVFNHSQVWFFFEVKNNDTIANLNRKNTISTTHWIYNIDKRLPLKSIIPSIIELKYKHANSLHSEEGMHDYFSYSDTISKKLSYLEFDTVIFKTDSLTSREYLNSNYEKFENYYNINLIFTETKAWINDMPFEKKNFKTNLLKIIESSPTEKQKMLYLNFTENISYQGYLFYRTIINSIVNENIKLNNLEFIFNEEKVGFCDCLINE